MANKCRSHHPSIYLEDDPNAAIGVIAYPISAVVDDKEESNSYLIVDKKTEVNLMSIISKL